MSLCVTPGRRSSQAAAEVKSASDEKPSVEIPAGTKQLLQVDV